MSRLHLSLSRTQRDQLLHLRDHSPKPYLRERAAAILKVADGWSCQRVASSGLLQPRDEETVAAWVHRYAAEGMDGLPIRPGRGRKPAFFPLRPDGSRG